MVSVFVFLHSCSMNTYTKVLINGNSSTSRVSVQIFSIVNMNVIYLHCQVQICVQIGEDSCMPVSTLGWKIIQSSKWKLLSLLPLTDTAVWMLRRRQFSSQFFGHLSIFFQDCLQRTLWASRNMIGTAFGSSGPLLKSDEGKNFLCFFLIKYMFLLWALNS